MLCFCCVGAVGEVLVLLREIHVQQNYLCLAASLGAVGEVVLSNLWEISPERHKPSAITGMPANTLRVVKQVLRLECLWLLCCRQQEPFQLHSAQHMGVTLEVPSSSLFFLHPSWPWKEVLCEVGIILCWFSPRVSHSTGLTQIGENTALLRESWECCVIKFPLFAVPEHLSKLGGRLSSGVECRGRFF